MKALNIVCWGFVLLCLVFPAAAGAQNPMTISVGQEGARVALLSGSAQMLPSGTGTWLSLAAGKILAAGDEVKTGPGSRLELALPGNAVVRFADNSHFKVVAVKPGKEGEKGNIKFAMTLGKAWANVSRMTGIRSNFELSSENAVAGVRGTVYRMNVDDDKSVLVRTYEGEVSVSGGERQTIAKPQPVGPPQKIPGPTVVPGPRKVTMEEWTYIIRSMQQIRVGADGSPEKPRAFTEDEDREEWVDWNKNRDVTIPEGQSDSSL